MKRQVLIVEDNALNKEILREILSTQYRVLEAENGQDLGYHIKCNTRKKVKTL